MLVRDTRDIRAQQVKGWWARVRRYTQLVNRLSARSAKDLIHVNDMESVIRNMNAQFKAIENTPYPKSATHIRGALLAFLMNMITVMQHTRLENDDDRNVIFDIAMVDKNMVEIYLNEHGLSL